MDLKLPVRLRRLSVCLATLFTISACSTAPVVPTQTGKPAPAAGEPAAAATATTKKPSRTSRYSAPAPKKKTSLPEIQAPLEADSVAAVAETNTYPEKTVEKTTKSTGVDKATVTVSVPDPVTDTIAKAAEVPAKQPIIEKPANENQSTVTVSVPAASKTAPVTQAKPLQIPAPAPAPKVSVTLESLPLTINGWVIDRSPMADDTCSLSSKPVTIEDGAGGTPVRVVFGNDSVALETRSNIDLSYENSKLQIGDIIFGFDSVRTETVALIAGSPSEMRKALNTAKMATVELGFWPSWPKTTTHQAQIPTSGFDVVESAWEKCNQLL